MKTVLPSQQCVFFEFFVFFSFLIMKCENEDVLLCFGLLHVMSEYFATRILITNCLIIKYDKMGRPKKEDTEKKLALLQTIREKKAILFGQFSSDVEKLTIDAAWEDVLCHAKSLALVTEKRDTSYVRKLFSQWKSRTLVSFLTQSYFHSLINTVDNTRKY